MSAYELKDRLIEAINTNRYDWIVVNFANADMVGHTRVYSAIQTAVQTIDQCLSELVEAAKAKGLEFQNLQNQFQNLQNLLSGGSKPFFI